MPEVINVRLENAARFISLIRPEMTLSRVNRFSGNR
jgi:hypothetical protein